MESRWRGTGEVVREAEKKKCGCNADTCVAERGRVEMCMHW